jgi:hypothetical protein
LIAGTVVDTVPIEVDGVTMGVGTVQTTVVGVVTTLTAVIVVDEHGHELSVRPFCGGSFVVLTGSKEEGGKNKEEGGKRKEERDYSVADISHSTFHIPLSTKFIYIGNHNYQFQLSII